MDGKIVNPRIQTNFEILDRQKHRSKIHAIIPGLVVCTPRHAATLDTLVTKPGPLYREIPKGKITCVAYVSRSQVVGLVQQTHDPEDRINYIFSIFMMDEPINRTLIWMLQSSFIRKKFPVVLLARSFRFFLLFALALQRDAIPLMVCISFMRILRVLFPCLVGTHVVVSGGHVA